MGEKTVLPQTFAEIDLNYYLNLVRDDSAVKECLNYAPSKSFSPDKNALLLITSDSIGQGLEGLGAVLFAEFFQSLIRSKTKPGVIILVNSGVTLANKEPFAGRLLLLEEQGVKIMVCISSADKYGMMDSIKAGFLASMDEICTEILSAAKVVTL